jgi:hypothetical protein
VLTTTHVSIPSKKEGLPQEHRESIATCSIYEGSASRYYTYYLRACNGRGMWHVWGRIILHRGIW